MKPHIAAALAWLMLSCNEPGRPAGKSPDDSITDELGWLSGQWRNTSANGVSTEIWTKENDSVMRGKNYFISGKDTVSTEDIRLEMHGNELLYIPVVSGQNNGRPVIFRISQRTGTKWTFENKAHDFPTTISYEKIGDDSLVAEISGIIDSRPASIQYPMKRLPLLRKD